MKGLQKHKKLIIILAVAFFVVLVFIVLNFTLFSLKNVEVNLLSGTNIYNEESIDALQNSSMFKKGKSVFTYDKTTLKNDIEQNYSYIEVVNIETKFPNTFVVHAVEREETFALDFNNITVVCDSDFKVLNLRSGSFESTQTNAIKLDGVICDLVQNPYSLKTGDFVVFDNYSSLFLSLGEKIAVANKNIAMAKAIIKSIDIDLEVYHFTAKIQPKFTIVDFNDFECNMYGLDKNLATKFNVYFSALEQIVYNYESFDPAEDKEDYYLDYNLLIMENKDGDLLCKVDYIK